MKAVVVRRRTRARELALHVLYMADLRGEEGFEGARAHVEGESRDAAVREYALVLVAGVRDHREEIDGWIRKTAKNWDLSRMAVLDRNVLRLGIYELLHRPEVPAKVAINEAIELGKRFSTAQSGAFVNGILDRVRVLACPDRDAPAVASPSSPGPTAPEPSGESPEA